MFEKEFPNNVVFGGRLDGKAEPVDGRNSTGARWSVRNPTKGPGRDSVLPCRCYSKRVAAKVLELTVDDYMICVGSMEEIHGRLVLVVREVYDVATDAPGGLRD